MVVVVVVVVVVVLTVDIAAWVIVVNQEGDDRVVFIRWAVVGSNGKVGPIGGTPVISSSHVTMTM